MPLVRLSPNGPRLQVVKRLRLALAFDGLKGERMNCCLSAVAALSKVSQAELSRAERRRDHIISTLRCYVESLGCEIEILAKFDDRHVRSSNSLAAKPQRRGAAGAIVKVAAPATPVLTESGGDWQKEAPSLAQRRPKGAILPVP